MREDNVGYQNPNPQESSLVLGFELRMSLVWYTLSYIPYGQRMAWRLLGKCLPLSTLWQVK